jgi:hypothetical protein
MLSVEFPVSSVRIKSGLPGTAILVKFMTTFRVRLAVLAAESVAVTAKIIGDVDPITAQSNIVSEYVHVPLVGVMVLLRPANCSTTDAPDSTEPEIDTPASFSARVTVSFPAIVDREIVGGVVSICHVFAVDDADELPAASVATAEIR